MKKRLIYVVLLLLSLSSCWAPKCPLSNCQFIREHRHSDLVTGTFSSRHRVFPRIHFSKTEKMKGEKLEVPNFEGSGKRKKIEKKFPWERW